MLCVCLVHTLMSTIYCGPLVRNANSTWYVLEFLSLGVSLPRLQSLSIFCEKSFELENVVMIWAQYLTPKLFVSSENWAWVPSQTVVFTNMPQLHTGLPYAYVVWPVAEVLWVLCLGTCVLLVGEQTEKAHTIERGQYPLLETRAPYMYPPLEETSKWRETCGQLATSRPLDSNFSTFKSHATSEQRNVMLSLLCDALGRWRRSPTIDNNWPI